MAETKAQEQELDLRQQTRNFEKAVSLFHQKQFDKAKELFQLAAKGPNGEMAHTAQMHERMCDRRMARAEPELKAPEDHYNYGVTLMNRGELERAEQQLRKALAAKDVADHIHYALALCCGLRGDLEAAGQHMKRAIELRPQNRTNARNDPDFHAIAHRSPLREILHPDNDEPA